MSNEVIINVSGLSKRYTLGKAGLASDGLRHAMQQASTAPLRWLKGVRAKETALERLSTAAESTDFWALRDVSFEIKRGDVVGIIGRNGAGKSTLLKILSRITEPTSGRVEINGRVASLLEVGTGFHPELTGRENIFLNGAILGMTRSEIIRKFDEIVEFAEVGRFLDTPVKRYSSGMYVRLAFAVAAHLEPEILIVDEVLAVGDAQFQKKCLGKMDDIGRSGRTVLFVSHNIEAVKTLCSSAVMLANGTVADKGQVDSVVSGYLASVRDSESTSDGVWSSGKAGPGVKSVEVIQDGKTTGSIACGKPFEVRLSLVLDATCGNLEVGIGFKDDEGRDIIRLNNKHVNQTINWPDSGALSLSIQFPNFNWIHGSDVLLGIYFGYIQGNYISLEDLMPIKLIKEFPTLSTEKIVPRLNKIFIDRIRFQ